ncbi:MAG: ATP-dependent Clp protease proteolytic subunit [Syntrophales bacterium]
MSLHVIHFMRSINPDTLVGLQHCVLSALQQGAIEITIHISSDGGNNDQGFAAFHFLRSLPVPITMHCIGNVESMAVIMYLAGERRLIVPHGKVKIHPMHWGFNTGTVDHDRLAEFVTSLDFDAKRYADIFDERTQGANKIVDVRSHLAGKAEILGASAAVDSGIATTIADAVIPAAAIRWWV